MTRLNPFALGRMKLSKLWEAAIDGHVVSLAWSDPLGLIAAASADGPIALFDAATGQPRCNLPGHGFGTAQVAWSPDSPSPPPLSREGRGGNLLASAGQDGKVRLWDPVTGTQTREMPAGAAWVERVAWCPNASGILASAAGKKLRLWNAAGELLCEYPDHPSTITDLQWNPKEPILASAAYGKLSLWPLPPVGQAFQPDPGAKSVKSVRLESLTYGRGEIKAVREFAWQGSMLALAWSPDAKYIAAGGQDATVHFWNLSTGDDLQMAGYPRKVRELAWDASSRWLATGGADVVCVWDFAGKGPAGTTPIQLESHKSSITCLTYQPKGDLLASGGEDGQVALWRPHKQRGVLAIAKHDAEVSQLAWSTDNRRLAVGTANGGIVLYGTN
ncbi:MAG: WD40 repeat domain-containing protein [Planctomycetes bacterium]|nr:WD40 repeat domain-containing protein [Planctomycetota bacterium]